MTKRRLDKGSPSDVKPAGCDEHGRPLDPDHPWNTGAVVMVDPVDRRLANLERSYAAGVTLAAVEAMLFCEKHGVLWPAWTRKAAVDISCTLLLKRLPKKRGRTGNALAQYKADFVHWTRWAAVDDIRDYQQTTLKEHRQLVREFSQDPEMSRRLERSAPRDFGTGWDKCYEEASRQLRGTFAQGSPAAMEASYKTVNRTTEPRSPFLDECLRLLDLEDRGRE